MGNAFKLLLRLSDLAFLAATGVKTAADSYKALRAELDKFTAENRDPTDAELAGLLKKTEDLSARLDAADDKLNG